MFLRLTVVGAGGGAPASTPGGTADAPDVELAAEPAAGPPVAEDDVVPVDFADAPLTAAAPRDPDDVSCPTDPADPHAKHPSAVVVATSQPHDSRFLIQFS
jgi:hypothetical protein